MPEGPEVKVITLSLREVLLNKYLVSYEILPKCKYSPLRYVPGKHQFPGAIPGTNLVKLPLKLLNIHCKGKHIFFIYFNATNNSYITMEATLGMEGKFSWAPNNNVQVTFHFSDTIGQFINIVTTTLYFSDTLQYGNLWWLDSNAYSNKLLDIGPDLLSEDVKLEQWMQVFRTPKLQNKQICEFLLSQNTFSGIGNYLKSEILYRAKIMPNRLLMNITDEEAKRIFEISVATIRESFASGGLSVRTFLHPSGNLGLFKRIVYECEFDPLGNRVEKATFNDKRMSHFVRNIQT